MFATWARLPASNNGEADIWEQSNGEPNELVLFIHFCELDFPNHYIQVHLVFLLQIIWTDVGICLKRTFLCSL